MNKLTNEQIKIIDTFLVQASKNVDLGIDYKIVVLRDSNISKLDKNTTLMLLHSSNMFDIQNQ